MGRIEEFLKEGTFFVCEVGQAAVVKCGSQKSFLYRKRGSFGNQQRRRVAPHVL